MPLDFTRTDLYQDRLARFTQKKIYRDNNDVAMTRRDNFILGSEIITDPIVDEDIDSPTFGHAYWMLGVDDLP